MKDKSEKLLACLKTGKRNAQLVPDIAKALGVDVREVSNIASDLRNHDYNVIGDSAGMYIAETDEEILHFVRCQHSRGVSNFKSISKMRKYLKGKGILPRGL